jgi:glycosyltransferase involved in cell wall biosynthesis
MFIALSLKSRPRVVAVHHWPIARYSAFNRFVLLAARRAGWIDEEVYVADCIAPQGATIIPNPLPPSAPWEASDAVDLLCVARHSSEKNLLTLVRAMTLLPGRRLTLIGTGPLTKQLREAASLEGVAERVDFLGAVSHPRVLGYLRGCSAVVLPSLWEAMPITLLEAISADADIVVSDIAAHHFIVDADAGLTFRADDPQALAAAVETLGLSDVRRRLRQGRAAFVAMRPEDAVIEAWTRVLAHPRIQLIDHPLTA